jgi:CDGSH-type Zn-finger protein
MTDKPTLSERENGPLVVKGLTSMQDAGGQDIECKPVMALCRCGQSKNKPFCDGSHKDAGFQSRGGKPAGRDRLITYTGTQVSVTYNPILCSHAAECGRLASHMFNPAQKPWVQPNNGTVEEVHAVIAACPSGALALVGSTGPEHLSAARAQVVVEKNGPYWVQDIDAPTDPQGEAMNQHKYVLCRCGKSGNKPYCDGTHRDVGWEDGS